MGIVDHVAEWKVDDAGFGMSVLSEAGHDGDVVCESFGVLLGGVERVHPREDGAVAAGRQVVRP